MNKPKIETMHLEKPLTRQSHNHEKVAPDWNKNKDIFIGAYPSSEGDLNANAIDSWLQKASAELAVEPGDTAPTQTDPEVTGLLLRMEDSNTD